MYQNELDEMGIMSKSEKFMIGIFLIALILWILGSVIHIDATLTAFIALSLLLITGVLAWSDILNETGLEYFSMVLNTRYDG